VNWKTWLRPAPAEGVTETGPKVEPEPELAVVNDQTGDEVDPAEFLATTRQ